MTDLLFLFIPLAVSAAFVSSLGLAAANPPIPEGFCTGKTGNGEEYGAYIQKTALHEEHAQRWADQVRRAQRHFCGEATF